MPSFPIPEGFAELADSFHQMSLPRRSEAASVVTSLGLLEKNEAKHGDMVTSCALSAPGTYFHRGACFDSDHPRDLVLERICSLLSNLSPLALTGKRNDHFAICRKSVWFTY